MIPQVRSTFGSGSIAPGAGLGSCLWTLLLVSGWPGRAGWGPRDPLDTCGRAPCTRWVLPGIAAANSSKFAPQPFLPYYKTRHK